MLKFHRNLVNTGLLAVLMHRYLKSLPARGGLKVLKGMQQNRTAIYLGVGEPITRRCFQACCVNKSKDIKSLPLPILSKGSNSSS